MTASVATFSKIYDLANNQQAIETNPFDPSELKLRLMATD
jgi:hypothetical protein